MADMQTGVLLWRVPSLLLVSALALGVLLSACSGGGTEADSTAFGNGIHAVGTGTVTGRPDIAVLSVGVESLGDTVGEAHDDAADAIAAIVAGMRAEGVAEDDVRTEHFSIYPRYDYNNGSELVGYQATNTLTVVLRDLENVGSFVKVAVEAGGDLTRVQRVDFRIEDEDALREEARRLALQDALAKADLFAEQMGVSRGKLMFVTESYLIPLGGGFGAIGAGAFDDETPIQLYPGEVEVRVNIQAMFAIE